MSGFPRLPTRSSFGPTMENVRAVQNPKKELGADPINLALWQVAGAGRTVPSAVLHFDPTAASGAGEVTAQFLTFDPDGQLGDISHAVNATGEYTFTFASTYDDETGTAVSFAPKVALASLTEIDATNPYVANAEISGLDVNVTVFRADTGAKTDKTIAVLVWGATS